MTDYATSLIEEEDKRPFPYRCSSDKLTIGIGRNLDDVGLSADEIEYLYKNDEQRAIKGASSLVDEFEWLSDDRKIALVNMVFQMGTEGVSRFKKMVAAINAGNFHEAANEMLDSKWAKQTPRRANEMSDIIRSLHEEKSSTKGDSNT